MDGIYGGNQILIRLCFTAIGNDGKDLLVQ